MDKKTIIHVYSTIFIISQIPNPRNSSLHKYTSVSYLNVYYHHKNNIINITEKLLSQNKFLDCTMDTSNVKVSKPNKGRQIM